MRVLRLFGVGMMILGFILAGMEKAPGGEKISHQTHQRDHSFAPGDTDNNLRPFTDKMAQYLGQPLNFVYKPGASGAVGQGSCLPPSRMATR